MTIASHDHSILLGTYPAAANLWWKVIQYGSYKQLFGFDEIGGSPYFVLKRKRKEMLLLALHPIICTTHHAPHTIHNSNTHTP